VTVALVIVMSSVACAQRAPGRADPVLVEDTAFPGPARPLRAASAPPIVSEASRDRSDEARRVAELLRLAPGQRIAELEAGSGYYAIRFARALGPASPVMALDDDPSALAFLDGRAADLGLPWLQTQLSTESDPRLAPGAADIVIVADGYATIPEPYAFFARLGAAIAGGGRLAVVALDLDVQLGGTPLALVRCELEAVGYELEMSYRLVPVDRYLAVFTPPEAPVRASAVRACASDGSRSGLLPGR
jgi:hypothetical protein